MSTSSTGEPPRSTRAVPAIMCGAACSRTLSSSQPRVRDRSRSARGGALRFSARSRPQCWRGSSSRPTGCVCARPRHPRRRRHRAHRHNRSSPVRRCRPHRRLPHRRLPHRHLPHRHLPHRHLPHRHLPHGRLPRARPAHLLRLLPSHTRTLSPGSPPTPTQSVPPRQGLQRRAALRHPARRSRRRKPFNRQRTPVTCRRCGGFWAQTRTSMLATLRGALP